MDFVTFATSIEGIMLWIALGCVPVTLWALYSKPKQPKLEKVE